MRDGFISDLTLNLPPCASCLVKQFAVCSDSEAAALQALEDAKIYHKFSEGELIGSAGQTPSFVGTIMSGAILLADYTAGGDKQNLAIMYTGDFLGRPGLATNPFEVQALTNVEICGFRPRVFDDLLANFPDLQNRLVQMMFDELDTAHEWMLIIGRKTATEQVASIIVQMAYRQHKLSNKTIDRHNIEVQLLLKRHHMADFLGITHETVSRIFSDFVRNGIVRLVGKSRYDLLIPDFDKLLEIAGIDDDGGFISRS